MRRLILTALFTLLTCAAAQGQVANRDDNATKNRAERDCRNFVRSTAKETDDLLFTTQHINDAEARECIYDDAYVFTNPSGVVRTREQVMAEARANNYRYTEFKKVSEKALSANGTTVLVTAVHQEGTFRGRDITGDYIYTRVYIKKRGRWRLLAAQSTRVAAKQ